MRIVTDLKIVRNPDSSIGERSWTIQILRQDVVVSDETIELECVGQPEVEEIVIDPL